MDAATENIKTILEAETSLVFKTDLYVGREPKEPDNTVTLFDTPDAGPQVFGNDGGGKYEYAGVQARVRNNDYSKAMSLAKDVSNVLHDRGNEVVNNTLVTKIIALDNPFLLDWDDNDRARVVVNFAIQQTRKPST